MIIRTNYFYSPVDMAIKLNLDDNIDKWNKEEDIS